ncbi:hypothetical protein A7A76_07760 [Lysobacter enzymogenes]|uniref:hypothetical protein n=1 Tax=Lysobacter enzymogenes TaxID=69 RepID=UPI0019D064A2|nr:hypothetical protein [Lysobacter enzymogenes]MBN7138989.1 hypothetical protein [Lysobacter enzymogenes]
MGGNGYSHASGGHWVVDGLVMGMPYQGTPYQPPAAPQRCVRVDVLRIHPDGHMEAVLSDGAVLSVQGIAMSARAGQHTAVTLTIDRVRVEVAGGVETGRRGTLPGSADVEPYGGAGRKSGAAGRLDRLSPHARVFFSPQKITAAHS